MAVLVVLVAALPVLALVLRLASQPDPGAVWAATLGRATTWQLLARSLGLAVAVTSGSALVGVPIGVLLGRTDVVGRRALLWIQSFPIFLPPFLLAFGWFHLLDTETGLLFGPVGLVLVSMMAFAPIFTVLVALGVERVDRALIDAARVAAGPRRALLRVALPLSWPNVVLAAVIVFALTMSEIGVPMFLRVRSYPAAVFTRLGGIDYAPGEAMALVLPLLALGVGLVVLERRVLGRRSFEALASSAGTPRPLPLGRWRAPLSWLAWGTCLLFMLPVLGLWSRAGAAGLREATSWLGDSVATSLGASAIAATFIVGLGIVAGHALARGRALGRGLDLIGLLAFITPSAVLGAGMIAAWNRPSTQLLYATPAILVLGLVARYVGLGIRGLAAAFLRMPRAYEDAAAAFGSGYARTMARVSIPTVLPGVVATWLLAFVFCMRDLDTVVIFHPPGYAPLPVRIFTLEANGPEPVVAGLALIHVMLTATVLFAGGLLSRGRRR